MEALLLVIILVGLLGFWVMAQSLVDEIIRLIHGR